MFNNAGISGARHPSLMEDDFADFHEVLGVNLLGVFAGTAYAAKAMAEGGRRVGHQQRVDRRRAADAEPVGLQQLEGGGDPLHQVGRDPARCDRRARQLHRARATSRRRSSATLIGAGLPDDEKAAMMEKVRAFLMARQPIKIQGQPS